MNNAVPPNAPPPSRTARRGVALVLAFFALTALFVQYAVRLDYGPDEPYHLEYVHILATRHRLPSRTETYLVQHPPLYYVLLTVPWNLVGGERQPLSVTPGPDALAQMDARGIVGRRVLRTVSLALCVLTLLALARLVAVLGVPVPWQAPLLLLVAACPMFQYLSGVVNNENASILCSTVVCLALVTRVRRGDCSLTQALGIGLLLGLCPWVKQTTLLAVPLAVWTLWTTGDPAQRWPRLGVAAAVALPVGIGWPLHNFLTAGDPFPLFVMPANQPQILPAVKADPAVLLAWVRLILETSVLPDWSWNLLPRGIPTLVVGAEAAAALGLFFFGLRDKDDPRGRQIRAMALTALLLLLVGIVQYCVFKDWRAQIGGRYLLNGAPWFLALVGSGLASLARRRPAPPCLSPFVLLAAGLLVVFDAGWWYLVHLYYTGPAFAHA